MYKNRLQKGKSCQNKGTLSLTEFEISESILPYIIDRDDVEIISNPYDISIYENGYMNDFE